MAELTLKFSTLSRNAIIKECINAYVLKEMNMDDKDFRLLCMEKQINGLHIQLNPDWKRKRSLPFDDKELYAAVPNYSNSETTGKLGYLPPNGGDE